MNIVIKKIFITILIVILTIPIILISILVKLDSRGPILHWSKRVGINNKIFLMPKFRSMKINTPQVATHLLDNPGNYLTNVGSFIRKYSLDELPQLISILKGDMNFIGPRPALYNQDDLISLREEHGVNLIRPGVTGWAQVNGRDSLTISEKVEFEKEYLIKKSFAFDSYIILKTLRNLIKRNGISH